MKVTKQTTIHAELSEDDCNNLNAILRCYELTAPEEHPIYDSEGERLKFCKLLQKSIIEYI